MFALYGFPLFEWNEDAGRGTHRHPVYLSAEGASLLEAQSWSTDPRHTIVCNGSELASGTRIHNRSAEKIRNLATARDVANASRQILEAFGRGRPRGIAGHRRLVATCRANSIRDVIAFPKIRAARPAVQLACRGGALATQGTVD